MLTNDQIEILAGNMKVPLEFCNFKSELPKVIKPNRAYIINLDNDTDLDGDNNSGTHWVCFQIVKYPNGKLESIYFDSYGVAPPEIVSKRLKDNFGIKYVPYNTKNIQSLMSNACGYYCLAFLHFINACPYRSELLYQNVETFLSMFNDLALTNDFKQNEYVLKHFFLLKNKPNKPVEVFDDQEKILNSVTNMNNDGTFAGVNTDDMRLPMNINYV
jgi:hypothetical protein